MVDNFKIVALCLSRIQDDASQEVVTALHNAFQRTEYRLFVYNTCLPVSETDYMKDPQMSIYGFMDFSIIDVLIVHEECIRNQSVTDELVRRGKQAGVPVIVVGEPHDGCINILFDREVGFAEMMYHLVDVHHYETFHMIAGPKGNSFSELRIQAFRRVLEERNLPFDDSMISYGDFWSGPTETIMEEMVAGGNLPRAIVCANDMMALTVTDVLQRHHIAIPEQVAVTGFDGIEEISYSSPRISTVLCDVNVFAGRLLEILDSLDTWDGQKKEVIVPASLSIGQTCGCDGAEPEAIVDFLYLQNDYFYRYQEEDLELAKISERIQRCENIEQIALQMSDSIFYDMTCVVENEYLDETMEYVFVPEEDKPLDREMMLLFDTEVKDFHPHHISLNEVVPGIKQYLEDKRTCIFTALYYMDAPMGYVCFRFGEMSYGNYIKIPQTITTLNNAIGAFRNLRFEHYLMVRIEEMYKSDVLTGLYTRRAFNNQYHIMLEEMGEDKSLTVFLADLDRLKYINDNFGHKEGDFAIQMVAQSLQRVCPSGTLFTRFGGDEMLGVCKGRQDIEELQEDFARFFREFNAHSKKPYPVEASIGIAYTQKDEMLSFEQLVEKADGLMYQEKERHRKLRAQA